MDANESGINSDEFVEMKQGGTPASHGYCLEQPLPRGAFEWNALHAPFSLEQPFYVGRDDAVVPTVRLPREGGCVLPLARGWAGQRRVRTQKIQMESM
jgi:hypothetical protein